MDYNDSISNPKPNEDSKTSCQSYLFFNLVNDGFAIFRWTMYIPKNTVIKEP